MSFTFVNAQMYVDSKSVVWVVNTTLTKNITNVSVNHWGLKFDMDSLQFQMRPSYTGFLDLEINNHTSDRISIIWDESTLNDEGIVFDDMRMYQIGNPIKPSFVERNSYLSKSITNTVCANNTMSLVPYKTIKDLAKKTKSNGHAFITLVLCVDKKGKKELYQIRLNGVYYGKDFKDKEIKKMNEEQNFESIEKLKSK